MTTNQDIASVAVHPAEISTREFPRARRGLDQAAVLAWLRTVERAYGALHEECERLRAEKARVAASLQSARDTRASTEVRATLTAASLRPSRRGYDREQVEALLSAAADEIARLETRNAVLEAERAAEAVPSQVDARLAVLEQWVARLAGTAPSTSEVA